MRSRIHVALTLALLLAATPLHAGVIRGVIVEKLTGYSLAHATVTLQPVPIEGHPARTVRTPDSGQFVFDNLPAGSYLLKGLTPRLHARGIRPETLEFRRHRHPHQRATKASHSMFRSRATAQSPASFAISMKWASPSRPSPLIQPRSRRSLSPAPKVTTAATSASPARARQLPRPHHRRRR